jgi:hypothetical protein
MGFIDAPMGKTERAGTLWRPDRSLWHRGGLPAAGPEGD